MNKRDKIQHLLVTHLLEEGHIELTLPDGMTVEMGILKEGKDGHLHKFDDYSWVIASQKDRTISMDSFTFGVRYAEECGKVMVEESTENALGKPEIVLMAV